MANNKKITRDDGAFWSNLKKLESSMNGKKEGGANKTSKGKK